MGFSLLTQQIPSHVNLVVPPSWRRPRGGWTCVTDYIRGAIFAEPAISPSVENLWLMAITKLSLNRSRTGMEEVL